MISILLLIYILFTFMALKMQSHLFFLPFNMHSEQLELQKDSQDVFSITKSVRKNPESEWFLFSSLN